MRGRSLKLSLLVCAALSGGCSTGSGGGAGGGGVTCVPGPFQSCPVPATPDTAWVVNLSGGGAACNLGNITGKVGDVDATTIQQRVTDGTAMASVTCSVVPSGASYAVNAQASQNGSSLSIFIPKIDKTNLMANPAVGSVSFESFQTNAVYSGSACSFYFVNSSMGVGSGKIWVAYSCTGITNGSASPPSTCAVTESYAVFENCATS